MRRLLLWILAGVLGVLLAPGSGHGQESVESDSVEADSAALQEAAQAEVLGEADSTLVFEREVFSYPGYQRRNPFESLLVTGDQGPLFEDLTLLGVLYSSDPDLSVALLGVSGQGESARTFRVRRGDALGNMRILEIQPSRVVVDLREFGMSEQRVLELRRPTEGVSR